MTQPKLKQKKAVPKAKKPVGPISVQEIKFWLNGILEFQTDEWVPNAEQWETIKERIMNLKDTVQHAPQHQHDGRVFTGHNSPESNVGFPIPVHHTPPASLFDEVTGGVAPSASGSFLPPGIVEPSAADIQRQIAQRGGGAISIENDTSLLNPVETTGTSNGFA